ASHGSPATLSYISVTFALTRRPPPRPPLFPYTTLFRSRAAGSSSPRLIRGVARREVDSVTNPRLRSEREWEETVSGELSRCVYCPFKACGDCPEVTP